MENNKDNISPGIKETNNIVKKIECTDNNKDYIKEDRINFKSESSSLIPNYKESEI